MAFVRFLIYTFGRLPNKRSSRRREPITRMLAITAAVLFFLIGLSVALKVVDVVLHDQIISTVLLRNESSTINGAAFVSSECDDLSIWACPVLNRTSQASAGSRNDSSNFAVYEVPYNAAHANRSIAYAGIPLTDPSLSATGQTIAVGTKCALHRPVCQVENESVFYCQGYDDPTGITYNTTVWDNRPEIFLTTAPNTTGSGWGSMGMSSNPFGSVGFICFNDYSDINYSDTDIFFETPYVNWWMIGKGIGAQPYILCFTFTCTTWVYDGAYSIYNRSTSLHHDELTLANGSAALAVSGALAWMNEPPIETSLYQYTQRYIDDQLQVEVAAAGNLYGNDTARFSAQLAQSLSNRCSGGVRGLST